jgi:hypothetical protein
MGFSFLAPVFLAGLAALAIPIVVHLTHRERKAAIAFPSLMFVRKIPYRTHRRQKIRHWLLFLMRCLAIVLVAAAFARPLFDDDGATARAFAGAREVVVLLDYSHSMGYGDRWSRAIDAARRAIAAVGPEDRATLVVFAERAEAVTQPTADRAVLSAALDGVNVGSGVTRYGPAIQLAREIVERSERPRSEVILITDFQRSGWDARQAVRLPQGTMLTPVDLSDPDASNLAVTATAVTRSRSGGRERIMVSAQVANLGAESADDVRVVLEVEGEQVQARSVSLGPGESLTLQFAPFVLPRRSVRGVVRAGEDALPGDNVFRFVVEPDDPISILIVEPRSAGAGHSLYLRRALGVGGQPGFDVDVRKITRLGSEDLDGRTVVILNDAPFPRDDVGERLRAFVKGGGGLLVLLGRRSPPGAWPADGMGFLPVAFGGPLDRSSRGGATLSYLDYEHRVFELFRTPRSGDFSSARFFRYRRLEGAESARILARFDDGSVALAEGRQGDGIVLVWATDFENFWNDLAVQPVFLPFTHLLVKHLSGYVEPRPWFRVGNVIDLAESPMFAGEEASAEAELVVERPSGLRMVFRLGEENRFLLLNEAGFHRVRYVGDVDDGVLVAAANLDPGESNLAAIDPEEMVGAVTAAGDTEEATLEATVLLPEDRERRQGLWWYLLAGAAALLLLETLISNRLGRARAQAQAGARASNTRG